MAKQPKSDNTKLWIRVLCGFLGALMVFGIVVMVISSFSTAAYAVKESDPQSKYSVESTEISVGLCYASSAAQSYLLSSDNPLSIKSDNFSINEVSNRLIVSVDDNEYIYNGEITNNPMGVNILGGYHVRVSFLQSGNGSGSGGDNPVLITPGVSGGASGESSFTKDNIKEYVSQFNSSDNAVKLGVYAFPTYYHGDYYMSIGNYTTENEALELLTELQKHYALNASIASPSKDVITVHTDEYKILFETDEESNLEIHSSGNLPISTKNGKMYYGYFRFYRDNTNEKDALEVINTLDIDDYVKSVMSVELSNDYSAEMLKASAVVFRTSAYKKIIDHAVRDFDVCSNSHCQKYTGCAAVSDRIANAVDSVKGVVLTYENKLIYPVYSASCKSTTVSSLDAIGKEYDYLQSLQTNWEMVDDVYEEWKVSVAPSELYQKLVSMGYVELEASIKTVVVNSRSDNSLYATSITFTDILGNSVTITGSENIRAALDGIVQSSAFIVGKSGSTVEFSYYAENGECVKANRKLEGVVGNFVFSGEGSGSGVGYSISGAEILAKQGSDFDDILSKYYPGVEIAQIETNE